jgi:GAF domain-containing protein
LPPEAALAELANLLETAPTVGVGLSAAAPTIARLVPFDRLTFVLFEPDGTRMAVRWLAEGGATTWVDDDHRQPLAIAGAPAEWVRATGQTLHERDTLASRFPHHPVRAAGRRSFLLVPLGAPTIGVLGWSMVAPGGYPEEAIATAERIAALISARLGAGPSG